MATGTMVLVIASVLSAGMGGAVLMNSNDATSAQATDVVNDTMSNLCNGLSVVDATGHYEDNTLASMKYIMRLSPGSQPINVGNITLLVSNETAQSVYVLDDEEMFSIYIYCGNGDLVVDRGELLKVVIPFDHLPVGEEVLIKMVVENGQILSMSFTVPDSLGNQFVQF
jgi:archaellin